MDIVDIHEGLPWKITVNNIGVYRKNSGINDIPVVGSRPTRTLAILLF